MVDELEESTATGAATSNAGVTSSATGSVKRVTCSCAISVGAPGSDRVAAPGLGESNGTVADWVVLGELEESTATGAI